MCERSWSVPPEHWYDCVGELKRGSVGGKAPERQVCVGDHTKGRGERWHCQVLAHMQCRQQFAHQYSRSRMRHFPAAGQKWREHLWDYKTADMRELHWLKWKRINCVGHTSGNPWLVLVKIQCYLLWENLSTFVIQSFCMYVAQSQQSGSDPQLLYQQGRGLCLHAPILRVACCSQGCRRESQVVAF